MSDPTNPRLQVLSSQPTSEVAASGPSHGLSLDKVKIIGACLGMDNKLPSDAKQWMVHSVQYHPVPPSTTLLPPTRSSVIQNQPLPSTPIRSIVRVLQSVHSQQRVF